MRIGVVGSGKIGGLIGTLWSRAGHDVIFSSRHPERLVSLAAHAGNGAQTGAPEEAIAFGDVILLSLPFNALPGFGRTMSPALGRKLVLETANPYPDRDGPLSDEVRQSGRGTGPYLREWFPGVRILRAFSSVWDRTLAQAAHRDGPRVGIPLAGDDPGDLRIAAGLVEDAGFDPVIVGSLDRAREFDVGAPIYNTGMSGDEVRRHLGLT